MSMRTCSASSELDLVEKGKTAPEEADGKQNRCACLSLPSPTQTQHGTHPQPSLGADATRARHRQSDLPRLS